MGDWRFLGGLPGPGLLGERSRPRLGPRGHGARRKYPSKYPSPSPPGGSGFFHVDDFSVVPQSTLTLETFLTREAFDLPTGRFRQRINAPRYALHIVANWSTAFLRHRQLNLEAAEGTALGGACLRPRRSRGSALGSGTCRQRGARAGVHRPVLRRGRFRRRSARIGTRGDRGCFGSVLGRRGQLFRRARVIDDLARNPP